MTNRIILTPTPIMAKMFTAIVIFYIIKVLYEHAVDSMTKLHS